MFRLLRRLLDFAVKEPIPQQHEDILQYWIVRIDTSILGSLNPYRYSSIELNVFTDNIVECTQALKQLNLLTKRSEKVLGILDGFNSHTARADEYFRTSSGHRVDVGLMLQEQLHSLAGICQHLKTTTPMSTEERKSISVIRTLLPTLISYLESLYELQVAASK